MDDWPFDQPPNCAVISLRQIVFESAPILHVTHDSDDHGWQFLGSEDARVEDGSLVCLSTILRLDPSVREFGRLGRDPAPSGYVTWGRDCKQTKTNPRR
jgi:hypothetical protein